MIEIFLFFLLMLDETRQDSFDSSAIVTVFIQGHFAGRWQAAKYAGPNGCNLLMPDGNGEHVETTQSPTLLHNLFMYPDLNDVGYGWSWNPVHLLSKLAHLVAKRYYGVEGGSLPHNYLTLQNVAGSEDVTQYLSAVRSCINRHPEKRIVLFGCSRGAAIVINSLVYLTETERHHIALVIAEAPFATVTSALSVRWFSALQLALLTRLSLYESTQLSPLEAVRHENFPLDLPLAFVTSESDRLVPVSHTLKLIEELRARNHSCLEHLKLYLSDHAMMPIGEEKTEYLNFVNSLYKKYVL